VKPFCQQKCVAINLFRTHLSSLYLTYFIDLFQILEAVHETLGFRVTRVVKAVYEFKMTIVTIIGLVIDFFVIDVYQSTKNT
jgi:hypothetical protein